MDPSAFLLVYEEDVLEAGGDDKVMANWLPMALTSESLAGTQRADPTLVTICIVCIYV